MNQTFKIPDGIVTGNSSGMTTSSEAIPPQSPRQTEVYTARIIAIREVRDYTQHLAGRIKTLLDATISDPAQKKALKDLAHDMFWTEHYSAVLAWAEKEVHLEADLAGLPVQQWEDVKTDKFILWNVFPFSKTELPQVS